MIILASRSLKQGCGLPKLILVAEVVQHLKHKMTTPFTVQPQQKTVREAMIEIVQSSVDRVLNESVLPKIASFLNEKGITATAQDLGVILSLPAHQPAPTPSPMSMQQPPAFQMPTPGSFPAPMTNGFGVLGGLALPVSKGKAKSASADVDFSDPNWDDNFKENGCMYVAPRGGHRFKFCGAARDGGYAVCSSCREKKGGKEILQRQYTEQYSFNVNTLRQENQAKRLAEGSKSPKVSKPIVGFGMSTTPNFAAGNPLFNPQKPLGVAPPMGLQAPVPQMTARRYKGSPTEKDLVWVKDSGFVVMPGEGANAGKATIFGWAPDVDTMYCKLTPEQVATANQNPSFIVGPACVSESSVLGLPPTPIQPLSLGLPQPFAAAPSPLPSPMFGFPQQQPQPLAAPSPFGLPLPQAQPFGAPAPFALPQAQPFGAPAPFALPQAQPFGAPAPFAFPAPTSTPAPAPAPATIELPQPFALPAPAPAPATIELPQPFALPAPAPATIELPQVTASPLPPVTPISVDSVLPGGIVMPQPTMEATHHVEVIN
jgi:hypothetical protein